MVVAGRIWPPCLGHSQPRFLATNPVVHGQVAGWTREGVNWWIAFAGGGSEIGTLSAYPTF